MPYLRLTDTAVADLSRLRRFLSEKSPSAARRATNAIRERLVFIAETPNAGRPVPQFELFREVLIPFGDAGYMARYRHDASADIVYVVAIWHQRELGLK